MVRHTGSYVVRILITLSGGALFLAVGYSLIRHFIPPDQTLECSVRFVPAPADSTATATAWPIFAARQNAGLFSQARTTMGPLADRLIILPAEQDYAIPLRLKCRYNAQNFPAFQNLIKNYRRDFAAAQPTSVSGEPSDFAADHNALSPGESPLESPLRKKQDALQAKIDQLDKTYRRLDTETLALEYQLTRRNSPASIPEFVRSVTPQLDKSIAQDESYKELSDSRDAVFREISVLDVQAGRCTSASELKKLDQQRDALYQRHQNLTQQRDRRRQWLTEQLCNDLWLQYQQNLQNQIEADHHTLAQYAADMKTLRDSLGRLSESAVADSSAVAASPAAIVRREKPGPDDRQATCSFRLASDTAEISSKTEFSHIQWVTLALFGLTGVCLGVFLCSLIKPAPSGYSENISVDPSLVIRDTVERPHHARPDAPTRQTVTSQAVPSAIDSETSAYMLAHIDLRQSPSAEPENAESGLWLAQYDNLAQKVESLKTDIPCPVVVLTAAGQAQGSPRLAVNLAIALVRRKYQTLLIETDPQSDALASIFEQSPEQGFFEWRRGERWASQLVRETTLPGLHFMAAGMPNSEQMDPDPDIRKEQHRWENLRRNYNFILLYSPSVLAGEKENAASAVRPILDVSDAVIVQARESKNIAQQIAGVQNTLKGHAARLLGLVAVRT